MTIEEMMACAPYGFSKEKKNKYMLHRLKELSLMHANNCYEYNEIIKSMEIDIEEADTVENLPFLPVRVFKELSLKSVSDKEIVKTMTSSGTSNQRKSNIYLDKITAANQQKVMAKIVSDFTGSSRMPMIIIDSAAVIKDRAMFSARGAGILGFSIFGSKKIYALDDNMHLDINVIQKFLDEHRGEKIFLFGFTFMIWQHFYKELAKLKELGISIDLSNSVMIHGGGWKKLISEAVSQEEFCEKLKSVCGISAIYDYYGMVEQTGCIYMQCECGHFHASIFSDVITRRATDFSVCNYGEPGIIQVVSTLPESYPGHSLLTEDEGVILGEDDCNCGRKGKYFKILGRIKNAEIRGCSDTYAEEHINKLENEKKYDDVALDKLVFLLGNAGQIKNCVNILPRKAFDERVVEFCNSLSKELMASKNAKLYPDVATLAFWLRKSSVIQNANRFSESKYKRIGRGITFHIAPSNVPINFAYSLFTGLLTGNINIVRVPSKNFPQVEIVCDLIDKVLSEYEDLRPYIVLVRYDRDKIVNDYLSQICDTRVIWGGDNTIEEIRKSSIGAKCKEITFADRYSIAVIDADYYMHVDNYNQITTAFYNDTFASDQNACTTPRVVIWTGTRENINKAKVIFWNNLHQMVSVRYNIQPIQSIDKYSTACISAAKCTNNGIKMIPSCDNYITRLQVNYLDDTIMDYRGNSGFFYEYDMKEIMELKNICNNIRCQTISILGKSNVIEPLINAGLKGIDRVVPIGHSMDYDFLWDGYNMIEELTRCIVLNK